MLRAKCLCVAQHGVSNIRIDGRVAHFELGKIPEHATETRAATNALVANYGRQKIIAMPLAAPKVAIFEEAARTPEIPGDHRRACHPTAIRECLTRFRERILKFLKESETPPRHFICSWMKTNNPVAEKKKVYMKITRHPLKNSALSTTVAALHGQRRPGF